MKFIFLSGTSTTHFLPGTALPNHINIAERDTAVASVEPETRRQDDRSAIVTDARAGVDVRLSVQGHEESEWDGGSKEFIFCFCLPCVTSVRQQCTTWTGCAQEKFWDQEETDRKFWSMLNMCGAWRHPSYVRKKVIAICRDHVDETVVHVLRKIMPECDIKLVKGLYPNLPDIPYLGHKWC